MPSNFLEQLVAEWYEYQEYFVKRNVHVGRRAKGGYDCELDVVAFNPSKPHLIHIEPSMAAHSWAKREELFGKKFEAGRKHIRSLFPGLKVPTKIDQVALLEYASTCNHTEIAGGKILLVSDLLKQILEELKGKDVAKEAVRENLSLIRCLQFVASHRAKLCGVLAARGSPDGRGTIPRG